MERTYGSMKLDSDIWDIKCEPHVMILLKRLFPRAQGAGGTVRIKATDEICRNMVWFCDRYPMKMSDKDRAFLVERSSMHEEKLSFASALTSGKIDPPEFELAIQLREYQRVAVELALKMKGLLIADDVGVGKTACAIGTLTCKDTLPALIVTMPHLCNQWQREISRFAPALQTHIVKKGTPYDLVATGRRGQRTLFDKVPDVLIITYHKLNKWAQVLGSLCRSVHFDECQELRRSESDKYQAAKFIADSVHYRTGLSASPIYNYGGEFHSVIECIRPDALGRKTEFIREWCTDAFRHESVKDPKAFGAYLREQGIMIRRTRTDVGRELPPHQIIPQYIEADLAGIEKVSKDVAELAKIILQQGRKGFDKIKAAEELDMKMRQATGIAKAPFAAEFVKLLLESEDKIALFAWHREVYSILLDKLEDYKPVMYTGSESPSQKDAAVKSFVEGDSRVILISLRAGAGLDGLQKACRTTVHVELDWSPAVIMQNAGRVFRDGQTEPVTSYFLIAEAGSDPIISDILGIKERQIEPVLNPNGDLIEKKEEHNNNIQKLARDILVKRGIPIPEPVVPDQAQVEFQ